MYLSWNVFFKWHSCMFPMVFCSNSVQKYHFSKMQFMCDRRTDGHTLLKRWENAQKGWFSLSLSLSLSLPFSVSPFLCLSLSFAMRL